MEDKISWDDVVPLANLVGIQFGLLTRDEIVSVVYAHCNEATFFVEKILLISHTNIRKGE